MRPITIRIDVPALDRLLDYLNGKQQAEIDRLAQETERLTQALQQSTTGLQSTVNTNQ